ncbi:nitrate reductase [Betaproteobacteria bacterium GR16-43]|nr:nitrate reductase [Betaproteobacteria bacterium GR16-43]
MGASDGGEVRSTCPYCGVGCGVRIAHAAGQITGVTGDEKHPANFGKLCSKGLALPRTLSKSTRLLHPQVRPSRGAAAGRVTWDAALDHVADKFARCIADHGPDSVAFYISGQLLTEDYYVFNKLAKGLIGTNNVDTNSRLCMSSAVAGYKATLGADAPPACYDDLDHAACYFIAGSNMAFAHPVLYRRLEESRARRPGTKLVVVDPRRTDTAADADLHLPIAPGTDVALFNAMLHVLLGERRIDRDYIDLCTEGFAALEREVEPCTPEWAAAICEVPAADIVQAARWFADGPTLSLYCQGLNQSSHGTDKNAALVNLHLATGQIGRPGAGPFSLTGQPNAMGGREVGGMANLLSAHRDLSNPEHRAEVARLWGLDSVPAKRGKTAVELFDALAEGSVRCVWIACTNPAQSMPDQALVRAALERAEMVVLQDCYGDIETARFADVLLPASTWGEKDGTVTNSERRISRVRPVIAAPGEARADWEIASDFARRLGPRLGRDATKLFPYVKAADVFAEHCESTRGRDLDITGLSYALLDARGPQQWPFPEGATQGRERLYADGRFPTATGRARFHVASYQPTAESPTAEHPMRLTTGRLRDQWHGMSRTGRAAALFNHEPEPRLSVNPRDLEERGLDDGDLVRVSGPRGAILLRAQASTEVRPGDLFLPMHWGGRFLAGGGINALTTRAVDPFSFQPELKHAIAQVERATLPHALLALGSVADPDLALAALAPLLDRFDYASCGLAGSDTAAVVLRAASAEAIDPALLAEIDAIFGFTLERGALSSFEDPGSGVSRIARKLGVRLAAVRLLGDSTGADWLLELVTGGRSIANLGYQLLAPTAQAPGGGTSRGRILCTCLDVAESQVVAGIAAGQDLGQLQASLKCGTGCGSCVPALKRLCAARTAEAIAA